MNAGMEKNMRNDDFYRCPECDPVDTTYADFECRFRRSGRFV